MGRLGKINRAAGKGFPVAPSIVLLALNRVKQRSLRTQQPDGSEPDPTVFDDAARDLLTGSSGLDWFIFNSQEDKATDLSDEEFADALDFIFAEVYRSIS